MKQIFLFFLLAFFASCSPDEAPNPIQDDWKTLCGECLPHQYSFSVDGHLCKTTQVDNTQCGTWSENGHNRYMIYQDDMLESAWYVEFLDYWVARVTVIPAAPGSPASTFYMERI